jgi:hypothetical protein
MKSVFTVVYFVKSEMELKKALNKIQHLEENLAQEEYVLGFNTSSSFSS